MGKMPGTRTNCVQTGASTGPCTCSHIMKSCVHTGARQARCRVPIVNASLLAAKDLSKYSVNAVRAIKMCMIWKTIAFSAPRSLGQLEQSLQLFNLSASVELTLEISAGI